MSYAVVWHDRAVAELLALPRADAEEVDRAVIEFAATGKGFLRVVDPDDAPRELRLHVPGYYVRFTLDTVGGTVAIWAVRRLPQI